MTRYSIVQVGRDYFVHADDKAIFKLTSRRRAAQLICVASRLLDGHPDTSSNDKIKSSAAS